MVIVVVDVSCVILEKALLKDRDGMLFARRVRGRLLELFWNASWACRCRFLCLNRLPFQSFGVSFPVVLLSLIAGVVVVLHFELLWMLRRWIEGLVEAFSRVARGVRSIGLSVLRYLLLVAVLGRDLFSFLVVIVGLARGGHIALGVCALVL